jgi:polyhydroxyalkanoate synthesis regulator phasin
MMRKLALLAAVVAALAIARPALAQGPFADVPTDHWAYDAVNELAKQGIVNGYPDSTFGGKRALTRYEFAIAIQRALQEVQRRIDAAAANQKPPDLSNYVTKDELNQALQNVPTKEEVDRLRSDVDQLRRLMTEFQDTLAALGTDVDQLKRDVAALGQRLTALENEVHRMPKITGDAMLGFYGSYLGTGSAKAAAAAGTGAGRATDADNRTIGSDNILQNAKSVYDIDLGITARLSDVATAKLLLNAGNYIQGYLNNSLSTVQDFGNTTFETVRPYYLYIDTPLSLGSLGASITVGKFGQQFTPYTLKMVDVDSYFDNEKTDNGDYIVTGGRVNFKIGGFGIQAYAGQNTTPYTPLTSTAGSLLAGRIGDRLFRGNTNVTDPNGVAAAALPAASLLDQSAGVHVTAGIPFKGRIGATYITAAGTAGKPDFRRLDVYGGDLEIAPVKYLRIEGEYAVSQWKSQAGPASGNVHQNDRTAWDGKLVVPIGKLELDGRYKRIGSDFDSPGAWDKIGRWFNPTDIEGYGGGLTYPFSSKLSLVGEGNHYTLIGARSDVIEQYKAGFKFGLTSSNSVDLGAEVVDWKPGVGNKNRERFYNIGFGHNFNPNTSFKVLYQYIVYKAGDFPVVGPAFNYNGGVAVTEFSVRF